jgi:hypothetical protein
MHHRGAGSGPMLDLRLIARHSVSTMFLTPNLEFVTCRCHAKASARYCQRCISRTFFGAEKKKQGVDCAWSIAGPDGRARMTAQGGLK